MQSYENKNIEVKQFIIFIIFKLFFLIFLIFSLILIKNNILINVQSIKRPPLLFNYIQSIYVWTFIIKMFEIIIWYKTDFFLHSRNVVFRNTIWSFSNFHYRTDWRYILVQHFIFSIKNLVKIISFLKMNFTPSRILNYGHSINKMILNVI